MLEVNCWIDGLIKGFNYFNKMLKLCSALIITITLRRPRITAFSFWVNYLRSYRKCETFCCLKLKTDLIVTNVTQLAQRAMQ